MINKKAFTLTEVLIALVIIGAIGGLTLPSLLGNSNEKMFDTKYENTKQQIYHAVLEQMILHKTKQLGDTDFSDVDAILGKATTIFDIVPPKCAYLGNCVDDTAWYKMSAEYKEVDNHGLKSPLSPTLYYISNINDEGEISVSSKGDLHISGTEGLQTAILKNGVLATYYYDTSSKSGAFLFDLNNEDGPNIIGKDVRGLVITPDGKVYDVKLPEGEILGVAEDPEP